MLAGNILINLVLEQPVPNLIPALDSCFQVKETNFVLDEKRDF